MKFLWGSFFFFFFLLQTSNYSEDVILPLCSYFCPHLKNHSCLGRSCPRCLSCCIGLDLCLRTEHTLSWFFCSFAHMYWNLIGWLLIQCFQIVLSYFFCFFIYVCLVILPTLTMSFMRIMWEKHITQGSLDLCTVLRLSSPSRACIPLCLNLFFHQLFIAFHV